VEQICEDCHLLARSPETGSRARRDRTAEGRPEVPPTRSLTPPSPRPPDFDTADLQVPQLPERVVASHEVSPGSAHFDIPDLVTLGEDDLAQPLPGSTSSGDDGLSGLSFVCPHCDEALPPHAQACPSCNRAL
jgi:hypothetical protein